MAVLTAAIESPPVEIPTDFIVGTAGLGGVLAFAAGLALRVARVRVGEVPPDPVYYAGWGAGIAGVASGSVWMVSLLLDVSLR